MTNIMSKRISELRRTAGLTQEEFSCMVGVSPQAVSKWENNASCPDVMLLPKIAEIFRVSIDDLFTNKTVRGVMYLCDEKNPCLDETIVRIVSKSAKGCVTQTSIPVMFIEEGVIPDAESINIFGDAALKSVDFGKIAALARRGVRGLIAETNTENGQRIEISIGKD